MSTKIIAESDAFNTDVFGLYIKDSVEQGNNP